MKLRELVEKIDNDAPLFIVWGPNAEAIFKRESRWRNSKLVIRFILLRWGMEL